MNKEVREQVKLDAAFLGDALAAATAIAVSPLYLLGTFHRKACFAITVASANLRDDVNMDFGLVDDTVVAPAATTNLATLEAAGDTLKYERIGVGGLCNGCNSMQINAAGAADGAITLNGTVFPYAAVPATDLEWSDAATLIAAINGAGLGILAASGGAALVNLTSLVSGDVTITYSDTVTAIGAGDVLVFSYSVIMEVDASELNPGATGVRAVVDYLAGTGAGTVHGVCVKGANRYSPPNQAVAISL